MTIHIPRFSIVTPVLNGFSCVHSYVACLRAQTFSDWEAIVVDDGSSDQTRELLRQLVGTDPRFVLVDNLIQREVAGPYQARNVGLGLARGAFVCFLDIDDYWGPDRLARLDLVLVSNSNIKLLFGDYIRASRGCSIGKLRCVPRFLPPRFLICFMNPVPMLTACVSRETIVGLSFPPCHHEDYLFWHAVIRRISSEEILIVPETHAVYMVHSSSLSADKIQAVIWIWKCYRYIGYGIFLSVFFMILRGFLQACFFCRDAFASRRRLKRVL